MVDTPQAPAAGEDVQHDDADDAGGEVARGGEGEGEAAPAGEAERLIGAADVVGLAGALAVAHREQDAGRLEETRQERPGEDQADHDADDRLHQIGADDQRAALRADERAGAVPAAVLLNAQRHRDKADRDAVVGGHLQQLHVELQHPDGAEDQQQKAGEDRRGHQAAAEEGDLPAQEVREDDRGGDDAELDDDVPQGVVGG